MSKNKYVLHVFRILLLLIMLVSAADFVKADHQPKHLKLLAVSETGDGGLTGITADLYLEVRPGNGRVFIDTYPLSKLDTQISTRFANEIACSYMDLDCEEYDFFYTIKADTAIIGGPSAGSALSIVTVAVLKDLPLNESISITGTINSGGAIGPVGGLKEKVDAASSVGIKKVLIPEGERYVEETPEIQVNDTLIVQLNESKKRVDLKEYAATKGMELVEVSDINSAIFEFTGKHMKEESGNLTIDKNYQDVMKSLAVDLCNRSNYFDAKFNSVYSNDNRIREYYENAKNLTERAKPAFAAGDYYSAASFCFGANVKYRLIEYSLGPEASSVGAVKTLIIRIRQDVSAREIILNNKSIDTLTDLQALIVCKERIRESTQYLDNAEKNTLEEINSNKNTNNTGALDNTSNVSVSNISAANNSKSAANTVVSDDTLYLIAYAAERVYTVDLWARFFGKGREKLILNNDSLRETCQKKISEAEERRQYVGLLFPMFERGTKDLVKQAYVDYATKEYALCIHRASTAKAESSIILSVIGVQDDQVDKVIDAKLRLIRNKINEEQKKGRFPILGYSYYEYATNLQSSDKYSALLYSEYALEMSNLEMYFKKQATAKPAPVMITRTSWLMLVTGILIGLLVGLVLWRGKGEKFRKKGKEKSF